MNRSHFFGAICFGLAFGLMSLSAPRFFEHQGTAEIVRELSEENARLRAELRAQLAVEPQPVHVVCECPEYEEGWDDAEFAQGCDPESESEISEETLREMCSELDFYGYVPGC